MTFENDFKELMRDTLTLRRQSDAPAAHDQWGRSRADEDPTATPIANCRLVRDSRLVRGADGREVLSGAHAFLPGVFNVTVNDEFTLPDGTKPPVVSVRMVPDEDGPHHEVVFFA